MSHSVQTGRLAYLPVSLFGSVMGLCGLALAWRLAATEFSLPAWIGEVLGLVAAGVFVAMTLCYGIKCLESPAAVRAEFAHPVAVNFFGTPIISLLLLPAVVAPYSVSLATALWVAGTVSMLGFAWLIVSRWMSVRQQIVHATPAWMIPVVGTLNISIVGVTLELPGAQAASAFGLAVGLFFAVPLFTLILSRLIFAEPMPQPQRPSLLILVATFAVSFSAYLSVVGRVDLFASSLFYLAVFMFTVLVPMLLRLRSSIAFPYFVVGGELPAGGDGERRAEVRHSPAILAGTGVRTRDPGLHDVRDPVAERAHHRRHRPRRTARFDAMTLASRYSIRRRRQPREARSTPPCGGQSKHRWWMPNTAVANRRSENRSSYSERPARLRCSLSSALERGQQRRAWHWRFQQSKGRRMLLLTFGLHQYSAILYIPPPIGVHGPAM